MSLKDWADNHKFYIKLEEGEPLTCRFLRYQEFVDKDNEDREKVRYFLEVSGIEKTLESQSVKLAEEMSKAKEGDWVKITRKGQGRNTTYSVEVLPDPNEPISDEDLEKIDKKIGSKKQG
ncbi:MAG: hypothetical protein PHS93_08375 [Candidatus Omnitrophica bacterium]|nr:hypothetical protein [Candidatus Omnitrophota bacterium]MDD5353158.1 hypothetical protein [Candidatus Omnitrophota bacterium]MDD5551139.1 hypothetical protein [Candidatus Omnitrophota bacterium]